uniref:Uncharacterized protein n=1 Tax=Siphoviridae sp. ctkJH11 TaxID=2825641 RepID=A0A8S5PRX3_9CAUD|nr:MAG TPA: hypothetical protein [Siphoviridae sp. ctkJH11]
MKKYNLSGIMKRAWEMVKKLGFGISEALKKSWNEAKGGETRMTVTEKQISFASDLIKKMNTQFDALIADCKAAYPENVIMWESCKEGYNKIISESDAALVIELLKGNNETSYQKYYQKLFFNVRHGYNTMCNKILSEVYGK